MKPDLTTNERLAVLEAIGLRIETKLDNMDRRVSRLEQLGAAVTAIFTVAGFYLKTLLHK